MSSVLRDAIALQHRAASDLASTRAASAAWSDAQRHTLDSQCLDVLSAESRRILETLRTTAREIASVQMRLQR
jgi:hypothetical protein